MAKMASMYRTSNDLGVFQSRYCPEGKKCKKGKNYKYYKINACNNEDWTALDAARYVLIPINEL